MKKVYSLITLISSFLVLGQELENPDTLYTSSGNVIIQPILHGALVLSWNDKMIYVDPYGGAEKYKGIRRPDIILITDIHGDHLNMKTLNGLDTRRTRFFVPQAVQDKLPELMKEQSIAIGNGQTMIFDDMELLAVPMYNLPETDDSRHPKGRGNGYILKIGGKRIYISGDTEDTPEMRNLKNVDVAFVCMNLQYTMDVDQAASAVIEFKPGVVYPYHYRGKEGLSDVESFKAKIEKAQRGIEVRLRNWYSQ